jgi:hypothetical protein
VQEIKQTQSENEGDWKRDNPLAEIMAKGATARWTCEGMCDGIFAELDLLAAARTGIEAFHGNLIRSNENCAQLLRL